MFIPRLRYRAVPVYHLVAYWEHPSISMPERMPGLEHHTKKSEKGLQSTVEGNKVNKLKTAHCYTSASFGDLLAYHPQPKSS